MQKIAKLFGANTLFFVPLQAKRKGYTDREVDEDIFLICFSRLVFK
jgi:hypothetical protein